MTTATRTRKPRRILTPVDITARFPSFRSGRLENWAAVSRDGVWQYERLEISGTPWVAIHVPTGIECDWNGTLTAAREDTADGTALAHVERIQAHERGEHDGQRDPFCGDCGPCWIRGEPRPANPWATAPEDSSSSPPET